MKNQFISFRNGKYKNICFDHLQRDRAHHGGRYTLGQYPCHGVLGDSQYFCLADEGSLRNEYMCADVGSNGKGSSETSLKLIATRCPAWQFFLLVSIQRPT